MDAITVCVNYSNYLSLTLPYNRHHFNRYIIVTSTADEQTVQVAVHNNCHVIQTDVFYANGADFNKYAALEEGLQYLDGWIAILDADIFWPRHVHFIPILGNLYTPLRYLYGPCQFIPEMEWAMLPVHDCQHDWSGYTQIFNSEDRHLGKRPWFETNWRHAGGADSMFQAKWGKTNKLRPPFNVLHIGPPGVNWCGVGKTNKLREYMALRKKHGFNKEKL